MTPSWTKHWRIYTAFLRGIHLIFTTEWDEHKALKYPKLNRMPWANPGVWGFQIVMQSLGQCPFKSSRPTRTQARWSAHREMRFPAQSVSHYDSVLCVLCANPLLYKHHICLLDLSFTYNFLHQTLVFLSSSICFPLTINLEDPEATLYPLYVPGTKAELGARAKIFPSTLEEFHKLPEDGPHWVTWVYSLSFWLYPAVHEYLSQWKLVCNYWNCYKHWKLPLFSSQKDNWKAII